MNSKGRIKELDALRGIAVISVILFHYTFKYSQEYGGLDKEVNFQIGHYGVELFFIISGYVIFMTVNKVNNVQQFIWLRFTRLFPVYWIAIILTFSIVSIVGLSGRMVSYKAFLFNFTMLQDLFNIPSVDGAYWSLLPELMFYFLMALLIFFNLKKQIQWVSTLWLSAIIICSFFDCSHILIQFLNLKYGMLFIAGIQFYLLKDGPIEKFKNILAITIICLSLISFHLVFVNILATCLIGSFYVFFCLLHFNKLNFLKIKPLVFIGVISYPLYLIHQNIGYMLMNELKWNRWIEIILAALLSIILATLIHYYIEIPLLKKLRKITF